MAVESPDGLEDNTGHQQHYRNHRKQSSDGSGESTGSGSSTGSSASSEVDGHHSSPTDASLAHRPSSPLQIPFLPPSRLPKPSRAFVPIIPSTDPVASLQRTIEGLKSDRHYMPGSYKSSLETLDGLDFPFSGDMSSSIPRFVGTRSRGNTSPRPPPHLGKGSGHTTPTHRHGIAARPSLTSLSSIYSARSTRSLESTTAQHSLARTPPTLIRRPHDISPPFLTRGGSVRAPSSYIGSAVWMRQMNLPAPIEEGTNTSPSKLTARPRPRARSLNAGIKTPPPPDLARRPSHNPEDDGLAQSYGLPDDDDFDRRASASLDKGIADLERLLREALTMATDATEADAEDSHSTGLVTPEMVSQRAQTPRPESLYSASSNRRPYQVSSMDEEQVPQRSSNAASSDMGQDALGPRLVRQPTDLLANSLGSPIERDFATEGVNGPEAEPAATSVEGPVLTSPDAMPRFYSQSHLAKMIERDRQQQQSRDKLHRSIEQAEDATQLRQRPSVDGAATTPSATKSVPGLVTPETSDIPMRILPAATYGPRAEQAAAQHQPDVTNPGTPAEPETRRPSRRGRISPFRAFSLRDRHHVDIRESHRFNLSRTHRRKPIARDWGTFRKRYVAAVACISTALIGLVIGIYAGEVPAIQYQIVDENRHVILGNVLLYICLAIPTLLFWALPLLHGRKPYTLFALSVFIPLQLPQAIVVSTQRSPYVASYIVALLLSRAASGFALGFANINLQVTLLDLFGSSLQSSHPHQEVVTENDFRRHGGGMGIWLGIWTWCFIGSIGAGFLFGALIIGGLNPSWGFWITVVLTAIVLLLNVLMPEVRRSSYRRSVTEVRTGTDVARRVARGEVKLHLTSTGPKWWWEEVHASLILCGRMIRQPGFAVLSIYLGWVYAQIVMVVILLGALTSKYYQFKSRYVGLCVSAIPLGALLAVPFQKASLFSRSRKNAPRTDSMTFQKRLTWSSHLVRRAAFMIALPFTGLAYTLSSGGPPTNWALPTFFAGMIGFLSALAIAEGCGLIMETYDTSDLQPGMTGQRPRSDTRYKDPRRTNFSCYPRVSAGLAVTQTFGFLIAAAATGVGGVLERRLGTELATGAVAAVLLGLTLLLVGVLWRWKTVQVVPSRRPSGVGHDNAHRLTEDDWVPVVIGNPSGTTRRMSLLELGRMSRWSEIRRRNRLNE